MFGPDLLVFDTEEAKTEIARNWGFALLSGAFSVAAGSWALLLPFFATELARVSTAVTLLLVGAMNVAGSFFVENGYKLQTFVIGATQLVIGAVIETEPFASKVAASLCIAATVFVDGLYRIVLAAQNPNMEGWWGTLLSGFVSVGVSAYMVKFMDLAAMYVPGIVLGCGLISTGAAKILISLAGRERANEAIA